MKKRKRENKKSFLKDLDDVLSDDILKSSTKDVSSIFKFHVTKQRFIEMRLEKQLIDIMEKSFEEIIYHNKICCHKILCNITTYSKRCETPQQCKKHFKHHNKKWCSVCDDMLWNAIAKCFLINDINYTLHKLCDMVSRLFEIHCDFCDFLSSNFYPNENLNDWDIINMIHEGKDTYTFMQKPFDFNGCIKKYYDHWEKGTFETIDSILKCFKECEQNEVYLDFNKSNHYGPFNDLEKKAFFRSTNSGDLYIHHAMSNDS